MTDRTITPEREGAPTPHPTCWADLVRQPDGWSQKCWVPEDGRKPQWMPGDVLVFTGINPSGWPAICLRWDCWLAYRVKMPDRWTALEATAGGVKVRVTYEDGKAVAVELEDGQ